MSSRPERNNVVDVVLA